ncbi:hypothetical protein FHL15_007642 [Xylaria flabelliformis]|uniref:WSC domain-containing protein n=1 Tax=Xylaria flabelliformis TaxID=2512241 RepID=A0A553HTY8_9PEZI|nr:hypothetical protein FHL15_007642 [Xylaria flabelliformis]
MPSQSYSPPIARCLLVAIVLALGFLLTVSLSDSYASRLLQKHEPPPRDDQSESHMEKRLLGLGGVIGPVASLLGNVVPGGIVSSLVAQVTADINSLLPILDNPSAQPPDGIPLVTGGQTAPSLAAQPLPTNAQLGGLADKLGGLLNGIIPVAAPSIIAAITEQALGVVASVEAIATDVASLSNQIANNQIQAPDALGQIGGLLGSLDSKVNDIINGVTSDLSSDLPLPVLQNLNQVISSGLGDIVGAANGPLSLVGDLVEQNVCGAVTQVDGVLATVAGLCGDMPSAVAQVSSEIAVSPLANSDATLTGDVSASTIFPNPTTGISGPATTPAATSPQSPQDESTLMNPTMNTNGPSSGSAGSVSPSSSSSAQQLPSNANSGSSPLSHTQMPPGQSLTGSSISGSTGGVPSTPMSDLSSASASAPQITSEQSPTAVVPSVSMAGSTQPGQHGISPTTTTGVMHVYGYSTQLAQLVPQRPNQLVIVPILVLPPLAPRAPARELVIHVTTVLTAGSVLPLKPRHNLRLVVSVGHVPIVKVAGFALLSKLLDLVWVRVRPLLPPALGPLHQCREPLHRLSQARRLLRKGFVMAGTENGNSCLCGNFLNGTQKMDDSVCSMPCVGDATQMCGGLNALSCYSPDGQPYGWASAGPQPRVPTIVPPEVLELVIGGVAHTEITTPAIIFPPGTADPEDFISMYGKTKSQPLGELPQGITLPFTLPPLISSPVSSKPPLSGGGVAPGQGTSSITSSNGQTPPITSSPGGSTRPNTTPATPGTPNASGSPSSPKGPVTSGTQSTANNPNTSGTPGGLCLSGSSTSPNGTGGVAPGQVLPTSRSGESNPGITPTESSANPTSSNPGSGSGEISSSNPNEHPPGTSGSSSSTPNGTGGVAPNHGQGSSTTSKSENPTSVQPGGSTVPPNTTSLGSAGPSTTPTQTTSSSGNVSNSNASSSPNPTSPGQTQGNTSSSTNLPSPGGGPSSTPGQTQGHTSPGESPSGSAPQPSGGGATNKPSSSAPSSGGGVAPEHGQPSTSSFPSGIICTPGSSDSSCISSHPSEVTPPSQSQSSTNTLGASSATCLPGSNDPACTSPFGGGSVAPGHQQPSTSASGSVPSTATPSNNQSPGSAGSTSPNNPTRQTSPPETPGQSTIPTPSTITSAPTIGSSPPSQHGNTGPSESISGTPSTANGSGSVPTTREGSSTPPGTNGGTETNSTPHTGQSSISTPGGTGGVAPGQQSPSTQPTQSKTQISGTAPNTSEGPTGSITPTETPNTSSPNGGTPSPGNPGQPTASNPNQGQSESSNPGSASPQTSYTYPPGVVPYGGPSPSMRTIASMLAWREPDGAIGAPTMLHPAILHDGLSLSQDAPVLDYEEAPTTVISVSKSADPRWQRIRPVYVW